MMEALLNYKQEGEIAFGSLLFGYSLGCCLIKIKRNVPVFINYSQYSRSLMRKNAFDIEKYRKNPKLREYVVIPNLFFKPSLIHF